MASLSDFLPSSRGKTPRKSPFVGAQPRGRSLRWVSPDSDFQNSSCWDENDAYTSKMTWDLEQKVRCRSLQKSKWIYNINKSIKGESKQIHCPDWTPAHSLFSETPMADTDSKTRQDIEKALEIANVSLNRLKSMEEMLQELVTEAKLEEGRIAVVINEKFAELVTSLNSRKRKLETELVTNTSYYVTAVHGIQLSVTQKISNLDGAIKAIKQMKASHSLKPYHLNQVIHEIKTTIGEEVLKLDNLEKRALSCFQCSFHMDCEEITAFFENVGTFSFDIPNKHNFGISPLTLSVMEKELKNSYSEINMALQPNAEEFSMMPDLCFEESYTQFQEILPSTAYKWIPNSSHTASDPDVIIEEIFEDDQKQCFEDAHQKTKQPFGSKAESPELVVVSCVLNPCHFYVRKVSQKKTEVHLEKKLRQFCNKKSSSPSDILELGTRIFVKSKEHGMWCRADIIQLIPLQNTNEGKPCGPTKYKIGDIAMIKVFLIDFGHPEALIVKGVPNEVIVNAEHVDLEFIVTEDLCTVVRKPDVLIEAQLRGISNLALHCSLKDIVPKCAAEGWKSDARVQFLEMVNNKAVLMKVFREENGVLIVDLMKPAANNISSGMPVSLKDALVFLDLARFHIEPFDQPERNVPLQYFPPVMLQKNAEVAAAVSHIDSPDDFYIQLLEHSQDFAVLMSKIDEVYKSESGASLEILCPIQGQPCVANFDDDGIWYRAQVIGLLDDQEVKVKYVDFGNTAKINVKRIRKMEDEFLAFPVKAIRCRLADIAPYEGRKEWDSATKVRFEELSQDKRMLCFVEEVSQDGILSVQLYDTADKIAKMSCSINSILVKENLASDTASNTKTTSRSHNEVWDPSLEEILEKGRDALQSESKILSDFEDLALDCNKELQVRINWVVSPSKIYVHFTSSEQTLKRFQERMTDTYAGSESKAVQWTVDMKCAAYDRDSNQWQRGQVCKIVSEKLVEVFLFDLGVAKTLDTVHLRELKEELNAIKPFAVECFLKDIRPAGGTEQWTATACDTLAHYLMGALVTLIIQENNSSPLPVKILSKDGGLRTDVSEYMIKKGMALRKRPETDSRTTSPSILPEIPSQQKDADVNNLLTKTEGAPVLAVSEKEVEPSVSDSKGEELEPPLSHPMMTEAYKPPVLPHSDIFSAMVSCVSDNGTIYVIPKPQEQERKKLMSDIQNNFKCLGLLKPYSWKTGEACVVRAADTMWYRGEVKEVGIGITKVQYLDYGYIEKIPQCHLYPTVLYADIPPFSIPCELFKVVPVGNVWQQDAVELLQDLLTERLVDIHIMERPDNPWGKVSIKLLFAGMSLAFFMSYHKHCVNEDDDDDNNILKLGVADCSEYPLEENCEISHEELLLAEVETPVLPPYSSPSLPVVGHLFPVKITHVVSPNEVYICVAQSDNASQQEDTEDRGTGCDYEKIKETLKYYNENADCLSVLTDFRTGMPCLAQYKSLGVWYRAKVLSIKAYQPLSILVKHVDFGSTATLPTSRIRQIPPQLMQYPARAFRVLLAGFKPALCDPTLKRMPYCPEWTMKALWTFIEYIEGKTLYASTLTYSPEHTVLLYEDGNLFHMKLVKAGLAELC